MENTSSSAAGPAGSAAPALAAAHEPGAALANWLHRYTETVDLPNWLVSMTLPRGIFA